MDLEKIMEEMERTSENYASDLPSDGDWSPMLMITSGNKSTIVAFEMVENGPKREHLFMNALPNLIHNEFPNPDSIVMLVSSWYTTAETEEEAASSIPSENPERKEALVLQGISKDKELTSMAEIIRSESHPELDWIMRREESTSGGRLVGCLRRAVWT